MTSFEKIREIRGYQDENFRFEVKTLKKTVCRQINSFENVVNSTFQAIQIALTKDTPKSSEHLPNCNFANLLVCRTNGYHLTTIFQIKAKCFGKSLPNLNKVRSFSTNNQHLDHRTKFFYFRYDISGHLV